METKFGSMELNKGQKGLISLDEFIIARQTDFPYATGELSKLLRDIGLAAKIVNEQVNKAGLVNILGSYGQKNIHGEQVQKLDVYANTILKEVLTASEICAGIASEEEDSFVDFENSEGKYVITIDPLDGSSNIDVNIPVGTIFGIYRKSSEGACQQDDFLQKGTELIAAGYIVYGSSTMLVYTTGNGTNGFTLDPAIGEFCLSHPDIEIPQQGKYYSVNQCNWNKMEQGVLDYISYCLEKDESTKRPYSLRYVGSMVADVHRTLLKGGIFMYPATDSSPEGKLRLLYEGNPMAFLVEQANGKATDGQQRILDINPSELHQRVPVFLGSAGMVEKAMEFVNAQQSAQVK